MIALRYIVCLVGAWRFLLHQWHPFEWQVKSKRVRGMTGVPLVRQLFSIQLTRPRATAYLPSSAMLRPALLALLVMAGCSGGEEQSDATSAQSSTTQVGADNGQPDTDSDGSPQSGGADSQSSTEAPRGGNDSVSRQVVWMAPLQWKGRGVHAPIHRCAMKRVHANA